MQMKSSSLLATLVVASLLIFASKNITFDNQGDYNRVVGVIVDPAPGNLPHPGGYVFPIRDFSLTQLPLSSSVALFAAFARLQSVYGFYFDIFSLAALAKALLLLSILWFAWNAGRSLGRPGIMIPLAVVLVTLSFAAHNVAIFNTLYTEYVMVLLFPLLLTLMVQEESKRNALLLGSVAFACATAKTQFFYVPTLLLACMALTSVLRRRSGLKHRALALAVAQLLTLPVLSQNDFARFNNHNSTYMGSYMVMTPGERKELGLEEAEEACIGVDPWGNSLANPHALHVVRHQKTCFDSHEKKTSDVLKPYLKNPGVLFRLASEALPLHFTGDYFHVDTDLRYLHASTGNNQYGAGAWLVALTRAREHILKYLVFGVLALGLLLPFVTRSRFDAASLTLAGLIVSQIVISLIGEGVRDLSKHLLVAQLSVDWLAVLIVLQVAAFFIQGAKARSASTLRNP